MFLLTSRDKVVIGNVSLITDRKKSLRASGKKFGDGKLEITFLGSVS